MINKSHPDFPKYKEEYDKIWEERKKERAKVKQPEIKGLDGPHVAIDKKCTKRIKQLQQKYKHLFID